MTENGDLLQWGIGYSEGIKKPELTLAGKNLQRVEMSADRIFALSKDGIVYSLPKSKKEQEEGYKPSESGWIFFVKGKAKVSYKKVELPLSHFEKYGSLTYP